MKRIITKSLVTLLALSMLLSIFPVRISAASGSEKEEVVEQAEYVKTVGSVQEFGIIPDAEASAAADETGSLEEEKQAAEPGAADGSIDETAELMADGITINSDHFKPASFREYVVKLDKNNNFTLEPAEIEDIESITLKLNKGDSEIVGLQYFTSLKHLDISETYLEVLDVSAFPKLETLACYGNGMKTLVIGSSPNLVKVDCKSNGLTSLDVSGCPNLTYLDCSYNKLTSLSVGSCQQLDVLFCNRNNLSSLDVSKCAKLRILRCGENDLKTLNTGSISSLTKILCSDTSLTSLDLSKNKNLKELECRRSNLSSLNVSGCSALADLRIEANDLASLDLKTCTSLIVLKCDGNKLTSLDLSSSKNLEGLTCNKNNITNLQLPLNADGSLEIQTLECSSNPLDSLGTNKIYFTFTIDCSHTNLSGDLNLHVEHGQFIDLNDTKLTSLTISTTDSTTPTLQVWCNENDLLRTVTIEPGSGIMLLNCSNNPLLKSLDVSSVTAYVFCRYNDLSSLTGVRCSQKLETYGNPNLRSVDLRGSEPMRSLVYSKPQDLRTSKDGLKTPFISYDGLINMDLHTAPVIGDSLEEITVITPPKKTDYLVGETFDPAGMEVQ
ncbi:MAG: leucine-rich repeat domain-containing protein, partial [Oscillospiraceae bacterium]|nr:leucine-rich repeat domain-containing protein [Oscillospiraceae bacterium]